MPDIPATDPTTFPFTYAVRLPKIATFLFIYTIVINHSKVNRITMLLGVHYFVLVLNWFCLITVTNFFLSCISVLFSIIN